MKSKSSQLGQEGALTSSIKDAIIVINLGISRKNVKNKFAIVKGHSKPS